MPLKVNEIFKSIQGESTWAGLPCIFIRLTGCNVRCGYCDTTYAYEEGEEMEAEDILARIKGFNSSLVELTGGEPLVQGEADLLIEALLSEGYKVLVETNGTLSIEPLSRLRETGDLHIILDIKTPSSGVSDKVCWENVQFLTAKDEIKFVLGGRRDYDWSLEVIDKYKLIGKCPLLFSPIYKVLKPFLLAEWIVEDNLDVRLNLQLHKIIWDADRRGV